MSKVTLRAMTQKDTPNVVKWRNKDFVKNNFFYREELTEQTHNNWLKQQEANTLRAFVIVDNETGKDVGSTFLKDINSVSKKAEFGIFIGEESALGKGLGSDACKAISDFGFKELGLNKIYLRVLSHNKAAIKAYEKAGYTVEGIFVQDEFLDGKYVDTVFMANFSEK